MATNPVTGDSLVSKVGNKENKENYDKNFDAIFRKEKPVKKDDMYWKKYFEENDK